MKQCHLVSLIIFLSICLNYQIGFSQNATNYSITLNGAAASKSTLPFWLTANTFGTFPNTDFASINTSFYGDITTKKKSFNLEYKASFTGFLSPSKKSIINELYGTLQFKKWHITLGNKNDDIQWHGLSSSNGNIIKSTNTRALPGINITTNGYIKLPFAKNWLTAKFNYAEYLLNDKRVLNNAHLHHKSLYFKSTLNTKLALITGLDHYVQWGGTSPTFGKQPSGFKDYLRIITGSSGGTNATGGDQINALGNTVGAYLVQLNYKGLKTNWSFYYSHPFEDRSGREMMNYPDALYGVFIDLKQPKKLINQLLIELIYTKNMSGNKSISGHDNYFNNSIYESGWTYFGNSIGSPFFLPKAPVNGITKGVIVGYNRFVSWHLGFKGFINNHLNYASHLSFTSYAGWFNSPISKSVFSSSIQLYLHNTSLPFDIQFTSAIDAGNVAPNSVGGFIAIIKKGNF